MHASRFTDLPAPSCHAVIFSSQRNGADDAGYAAAAARMEQLVQQQPGFLAMDSARDAQGFGITVAYFDSEAAIKAWRDHPEHAQVRAQGRASWYEGFAVRVARVERTYSWERTHA